MNMKTGKENGKGKTDRLAGAATRHFLKIFEDE